MNWTTPTRTSLTRMTRALTYLAGAMTLVLSGFLTAPAQQSDRLTPPKVEAKLVLGGASFADPSIPHGIVGGAVRVYLTRRLSVEPEFLYMRHDRHDQDYFLQVNAAYETMARDKLFGEKSDHTGMTAWYVGPLLNLTWTDRLSANLGVDVPLSISNNGFQNVPDYRIRGGVAWRF